MENLENKDIMDKSSTRAYNFISVICTLGPSSYETEILRSLIKNNMIHIFCLDMTINNDPDFNYDLIKKIRKIECDFRGKNHWRPLIGIALQIRGNEIRTGFIDNNKFKNNFIELQRNHKIELTTNKDYYRNCSENIIYINYENITDIVKLCDEIIIGEDINYRIILTVIELLSNGIVCTVKNSNILYSNQKVYIPGSKNNLPDITEETIDDLKFAKNAKVNIIFTSNIRNSKTIQEIRKILQDDNDENSFSILTKISNLESVGNLDNLINVSDGILLVRNELQNELPKHKMFLAQKYIFSKCNKEGKICVCSSQILNSMRNEPYPTPTESSDVRNTILDGVDCLMLTFETTIGKYPIQACEAIRKISIETRSSIIQSKILNNVLKEMRPKSEPESIALSAINIAIQCNATCIIAITVSGKSAMALAKCNPPCPIIAVTEKISTARQLFLYRGLMPIWPNIPILHLDRRRGNWMIAMEKSIEYGLNFGKRMDIVHNGDCIIITCGWQKERQMNTMRVIYAHIPDDDHSSKK